MGGSIGSSQNLTNVIDDKKNYLPMIPGDIEELQSSFIVDASVCFFSMEQPINFDNFKWEIIKKGIFHHSGIILEMDNGKLVLLEYGAYPHRDENLNQNRYRYPLGNGLRYSMINTNIIFEEVFVNRRLLVINSRKLKDYGYWCVKAEAQKNMTLNYLINQLGNGWTKNNYNVGFYNCQDFTKRIISELDIEFRYKSFYNRQTQNHLWVKGFLHYLAYIYPVTREIAKRISNYNEIDDDDDLPDRDKLQRQFNLYRLME